MAPFKMFEVQNRGSLKKAVESEDTVLGTEKLVYAKGKAYYELTKDETIQDYKTVVVLKKEDNSFIWGEKVRDVLNIPDIARGSKQKFKLDINDIAEEFRVFVQSTSHNRIVEPKTHVLYQLVDDLPAGDFFADSTISEEEGGGKGHKRSSENDDASKDIAVVSKKQKIDTVDDGEKQIEVAFSFDTTGSMYACLGEVRRKLKEAINRLHKDIPGIRIAVIAHGDYCDKKTSYVIKHIDFTDDKNSLTTFVKNVGSTGGGDADECYELVLRTAHSELSWSPQAEKALVVIGDANPHGVNYPLNDLKLDWKKECATLKGKNIRIYAVQALDHFYNDSTAFYRTMAEKTDGFHIKLDQFSSIVDFMLAICYRERGTSHLEAFESEVRGRGRGMNRELHCLFDSLAGRSTEFRPSGGSAASEEDGLTPVPPSRFQVLHVDNKCSIKEFVQENSLLFKTGRGFYEFTKSEKVSDKKEVVLIDRATGDMYTGPEACRMIGAGGSGKIKPASLDKYRVFVQSTSYNRVLMPDTGFLYEVDTEH